MEPYREVEDATDTFAPDHIVLSQIRNLELSFQNHLRQATDELRRDVGSCEKRLTLRIDIERNNTHTALSKYRQTLLTECQNGSFSGYSYAAEPAKANHFGDAPECAVLSQLRQELENAQDTIAAARECKSSVAAIERKFDALRRDAELLSREMESFRLSGASDNVDPRSSVAASQSIDLERLKKDVFDAVSLDVERLSGEVEATLLANVRKELGNHCTRQDSEWRAAVTGEIHLRAESLLGPDRDLLRVEVANIRKELDNHRVRLETAMRTAVTNEVNLSRESLLGSDREQLRLELLGSLTSAVAGELTDATAWLEELVRSQMGNRPCGASTGTSCGDVGSLAEEVRAGFTRLQQDISRERGERCSVLADLSCRVEDAVTTAERAAQNLTDEFQRTLRGLQDKGQISCWQAVLTKSLAPTTSPLGSRSLEPDIRGSDSASNVGTRSNASGSSLLPAAGSIGSVEQEAALAACIGEMDAELRTELDSRFNRIAEELRRGLADRFVYLENDFRHLVCRIENRDSGANVVTRY